MLYSLFRQLKMKEESINGLNPCCNGCSIHCMQKNAKGELVAPS